MATLPLIWPGEEVPCRHRLRLCGLDSRELDRCRRETLQLEEVISYDGSQARTTPPARRTHSGTLLLIVLLYELHLDSFLTHSHISSHTVSPDLRSTMADQISKGDEVS